MSKTSQKNRNVGGRSATRHITLIKAGLLFLGLFAICHLLGWREDTAIISGTSVSPNSPATAACGLMYAMTYFLAVIVSPILILAGVMNAGLRRIGRNLGAGKA